MLRANEKSIAIACSAVVVVEPPGEFITRTPRSVAASMSTLSTPTPARPTTFRRGACEINSRSTAVALRTTIPSTSATNSSSFSRAILSWTSGVISPVFSMTFTPAGSIPSRRSTLNEDMNQRRPTKPRIRSSANSMLVSELANENRR